MISFRGLQEPGPSKLKLTPPGHLWTQEARAKRKSPGVTRKKLTCKCYYLWAMWPWENYLTSLSHCWLIRNKDKNQLPHQSIVVTTIWVTAPGRQKMEDSFHRNPCLTQALDKQIFGPSSVFLCSLKIQKLLDHSSIHHKNHDLLLPKVHLCSKIQHVRSFCQQQLSEVRKMRRTLWNRFLIPILSLVSSNQENRY